MSNPEAGHEEQVIPGRKQTFQGAALPMNMPLENVCFLLLELRVLSVRGGLWACLICCVMVRLLWAYLLFGHNRVWQHLI